MNDTKMHLQDLHHILTRTKAVYDWILFYEWIKKKKESEFMAKIEQRNFTVEINHNGPKFMKAHKNVYNIPQY